MTTTTAAARNAQYPLSHNSSTMPMSYYDDRPPECPPCFNCLLPVFKCYQFTGCNEFNGKCDCAAGFGGDDCLQPVCGSLADGADRHVRQGAHCECADGWSGINCNLCEVDAVCDALMPEGINGTCYKGGLVVNQNYQMCNVTNRKILEQLKDQIPQVTFSCRNEEKDENKTCNFEFWVDAEESFYCALRDCNFEQEAQYDRNVTRYACETIACECIPDRMLCGRDGSIDISDFLTESIKGPASFICDGGPGECAFDEPAMNDLIANVFGDDSITLECAASECLHYTEVPGFQRPAKPANKGQIIGAVSGAFGFLLLIGATVYVCGSSKKATHSYSSIALPDDEVSKLMSNHVPATLTFTDVGYSVVARGNNNNYKQVLSHAHGMAKPGEIMAIMGASGAGKTTLLDILARRKKTGLAEGEVLVNGRRVNDQGFQQIVGFVDQEDPLMASLTVFETVMYSALLRLPADMSYQAKRFRVLQTMDELGIMGIRDVRVGQDSSRGISGGEKRRVTIACELVTSPSILFMDEPTSGLDAYNAYNVVEALVTLARDFNRTIVFTIHQPRSNIVKLFDQLILLADGNVVYSGSLNECQGYFERIGHPCPSGYNIADYLIDLTMQSEQPLDHRSDIETGVENSEENSDSSATPVSNGPITFSQSRTVLFPREMVAEDDLMTRQLTELVHAYEDSNVLRSLNQSIARVAQENGNLRSGLSSTEGYKRVNVWQQFVILSRRTFKNLYRNPMLMLTHYTIAIVMALLCGVLYFNITNDISGFQNRLGLFFFLLALFGFSALTSLNVFTSERPLFLRERANGYYSPIAYFASKVLFDIIPLRVIPPIFIGIIVYPMTGLVPGRGEFFSFLLILVLFNLTAAALCLLIGILFTDPSVASLLGSLIMLFGLLFSGPLLNQSKFLAVECLC